MYYEYQDFSKNDKKLFGPLMQLGAQRKIEQFMKKSLLIHQQIVLENQEDMRQSFWEYFETYKAFTKEFKRIHDGVSHKDYPNLIAGLLVENYLSESDINDFSPEGREKLRAMENRIVKF